MDVPEQLELLTEIAIEQLSDYEVADDDRYPKGIDVNNGLYEVSLVITEEIVDIKFFRSSDLEVLSWIQYSKHDARMGYHYNAHLMEKFLKTVLVLDKMNII